MSPPAYGGGAGDFLDAAAPEAFCAGAEEEEAAPAAGLARVAIGHGETEGPYNTGPSTS